MTAFTYVAHQTILLHVLPSICVSHSECFSIFVPLCSFSMRISLHKYTEKMFISAIVCVRLYTYIAIQPENVFAHTLSYNWVCRCWCWWWIFLISWSLVLYSFYSSFFLAAVSFSAENTLQFKGKANFWNPFRLNCFDSVSFSVSHLQKPH